ncbi:flagellar export chaperone FliS [Desulfohalovibrio reitneri]|uniref:flagellar export chaperone FliS n=1 Tax=Desulfohalovibrio reitneri TaxID=1307759 RepID=UPI00068A0304|nr:flagellar export chaperone FliS [Desulfohalovibrio reitneri]
MQNAAQAYLHTQVNTTSQSDILILLYDGAVKFLNQAITSIEKKDVKQKGIELGKATDIINELQSSLNKEKGGELAENLSRLYFYCNSKLLQANLKLDADAVREVIKILEGLRSAYAQIRDQQGGQPQGQQAASRPPSLGAAAAAAAAARQTGEGLGGQSAPRGVGAYGKTRPKTEASPESGQERPEANGMAQPQAEQAAERTASQEQPAQASAHPAAQEAHPDSGDQEQTARTGPLSPAQILRRRAVSAYFNSGA